MDYSKKTPLQIRKKFENVSEDLSRIVDQIKLLAKTSRDRGLQWSRYIIVGRPPSVNAYLKRNKYGGYRRSEKTNDFYSHVHSAVLRSENRQFRPTGIAAFIIIVESPIWVSRANTLKAVDLDNTAKVVIDGFQKATGMEDERVWEIHMFKRLSKEERTILYVFDLGNIVDGEG